MSWVGAAFRYFAGWKYKSPEGRPFGAFVLNKVLAMTYFRTGKTALSSAQRRFTVLFGMGRGGANALWSPRIRGLSVPGMRPCERPTAKGEK